MQVFPSHGTAPSSGSYGTLPAFAGRLMFSGSAESIMHAPMAAAGTFTGLTVQLAAAPGTGKSWTVTLRVNGVDAALTVTVANAATSGTATGAITVAVGDLVGYNVTVSGSPSATGIQTALDFTADDAGAAVYMCTGRGAWNSTGYAPAAFGEFFVASPQDALVEAGTVTALVMALDAAAGAATLTYTLRLNGVLQDGTGGTPNTTLTFTGSTLQQTATFTLPVAAGDRLGVTGVTVGTPTARGSGSIRLDGPGGQLQAAPIGTGLGTSASYMWVVGQGTDGTHAWSATESTRQDTSGLVPWVATGLIVRQAAPFTPLTGTVAVTLRVNGVDTALTATISDATPVATGTGSVPIAPGDRLSYKGVTTGSVTAVPIYLALLGSATSKVGSLVAGVNTTVAATRAISFGLDGDTHRDTREGTFTVHGETWHDGGVEVEGDTLIHGDLEVEGDTLLDGDVTVLGTLTAPGVPGAPTDASYVVLSADTELTAERVLTGSGRVSVTDGGSTVTLDVPNDGITYAKIQNVTAASRLLGRGSASGSGDVEELTLGTGLTLTGTTLSASGGSASTHYDCPLSDGDLTAAEIIFAAGECVIVQVPV